MERRTKDLPTTVLFAIAPTRVLFETEFMKKRIAINLWSWLSLLANLALLFVLPLLKREPGVSLTLYVVLWMLPFSRIVEIGYAFYNDSFDQMEGQIPRSGLRRDQRFKLLGRSYFEVAVCYASLYLALPKNAFIHAPATGFESLYFSWVTITTTGFGDITPESVFARALCMTEIGVGLMLIVFAVGTYFSYRETGSLE
jgi:hypothetical protein